MYKTCKESQFADRDVNGTAHAGETIEQCGGTSSFFLRYSVNFCAKVECGDSSMEVLIVDNDGRGGAETQTESIPNFFVEVAK